MMEVLKVNFRGRDKVKFTDGEKGGHWLLYSGEIVSNKGGADKDMQNRVAKGKSTFGRLQKKIWSSQQYRKKVKIKM